jgi:hypothetical protein
MDGEQQENQPQPNVRHREADGGDTEHDEDCAGQMQRRKEQNQARDGSGASGQSNSAGGALVQGLVLQVPLMHVSAS